MYGFINSYDFGEMEAQKYYAPPASWSDVKKRDNVKNKIFSGEWLGAEKKDGYFAKLIKDEDGNIILYSRSRGVNGKFADKHEWVPHLNPFFSALPKGTCLLGELYFPSAPGSKNVTTIMGCLKEKAIARQDKGERLHFYVFDCLAYAGQTMLNFPARQRFDTIARLSVKEYEYVSYAIYYNGRELWDKLQEILARDDEGIVITHQGGFYEPGKRPSKTTLKVKKELKQTVDCFFTGIGSPPTKEYTGKEIETWQYWLNEHTNEKILGTKYKEYQSGATIIPVTKGYFYGWVGSLQIAVLRKTDKPGCKINGEIFKNKEVLPIGWLSGVTDEMKMNPKDYAFKPIEITAMEYDNLNNTFRHAKMVGFREDLTLKDCTYEKIIN